MALRRRLMAIATTGGLIVAALGTVTAATPALAVDGGAVVAVQDCTANVIPANDDGSSTAVDLPFELNFYGTTYSSLWVNNNGNVSFDGPLSTYTPFGLLATQTAIIAPFFADVDTRGVGSEPVRYGYGETTYNGRPAFCVNWVNVGYYNSRADKLNSFQLLLVSRPDAGAGAFDIVFNYDQIQWETGEASGGVNGFGGVPARAGFSSGSGIAGSATELPGSGEPGAFLDSSGTGLIHSRLGSTSDGRYVFRVRGDGVIADTYVALGDSFQSGEGAYEYDAATDIDGVNMCHRSTRAYPELLVADQQVRLDLDFRACSGARILDLVQDGDDDGPPWNEGRQIDALGYDTQLVTVGIVGNDLEFGKTVSDCVLQNQLIYIPIVGGWTGTCESNFSDDVDARVEDLETGTLRDELMSLYRVIRAKAPYARVMVVSYPMFFPNEGGGFYQCAGIRKSDQIWMNEGVARADDAIGDVARAAGFEYVNMSDVNDGHELCTDSPAMNRIVLDGIKPAPESFHPNQLGHRNMADRITGALGQTVEPEFVILPQQTVQRTFTVRGQRITVNVGWPGSDVRTTLVSPSGVEYTRENPRDARHGNGETYEWFELDAPEAGEWTVLSYGLDVAPEGEPVTLAMVDHTPPNAPPTAVVTATGSGRTWTFDASGSQDADGAIVDYLWDFGDGTTATGATATHTFPEVAASYAVALVTTDDGGRRGFGQTEGTIDVTPWTFGGWQAPVEAAPAWNAVRAGSAIPLVFTVDGPDGALDIMATGSPASGRIACDSEDVLDLAPLPTVTAGRSALTYDATTGAYTYVWKTDKAWAGTCRQLTVELRDGSQATATFAMR